MRKVIDLPLHYGKAPSWLFNRMKVLAREISEFIVLKYGEEEFLKRISDPLWFQSFGCVLGFDWHSSGLTTTTCGALKEGLKDSDSGIFVCGGKGRTSRKTPLEIEETINKNKLSLEPQKFSFFSKVTAKVDNSLIQDGFDLYHHVFIFTKKGEWAVIQQGMEKNGNFARRYHWYSGEVKNLVLEPHKGIVSDKIFEKIELNLVANESEKIQTSIVEILKEKPFLFIEKMKKIKYIKLPQRHFISPEKDIKNLEKIVLKAEKQEVYNFLDVLKIEGLGPKSIRALTLITELITGTSASRKDPATFSFAHGGKDGIPYPVDRRIYDTSIEILKEAIEKSKVLKDREKKNLIENL